MSDDVQLQPDTDEVLQTEEEYETHTVPVCVTEVKSPVRVQRLPDKAGATRTRSVGITVAERLLTADHRRRRAVVTSPAAIRYAFSQASCQAPSSMAWWPANVPLEISCATEVWVMVAGESAAEVSVAAYQWAAGE